MKKIIVFVTLILALLMCMASCDLLGTSGSKTEHTHNFGEWSIVKNATNTVDGLQERKCECGEIQQEVIPASRKEYTIHYNNFKSEDYPTPNGYNSSEGLLNLPKPESEGYEFIGWYTASIGGDVVDYIPKGSTGDYVLFAHWDLVTYDITYKNVPNNTNPTSYDIEDKLKLQTPTWSGLVFTHWSDEEGNIYTPDANITFLPEQMTGDLTLTANWKLPQNIAIPAESGSKLYSSYSVEEGFLYFFYDLGMIENVVLEYTDSYNKTSNIGYVLQSSKTVTISEEKAESIANTISESISSTTSWEDTKNWSKSHSEHFNATVGVSVEVGTPVIKTKVEASFEGGYEDTSTEGYTKSTGGSGTGENSESETISSSIAYKQEISTENTKSYSIGENLPNGYYACVNAANIRVIAVVSYSISTGKIYLDTYSRLDNMHSMVMYYKDVNQLNTMLGQKPTVENLNFEITAEREEEILTQIKSFYYIKYDANGGIGTMPTTMHSVGATEKIPENSFTREGYKFVGWEIESNGEELEDGQEITNLADALKTVTLKAKWQLNSYTVVYDANGGEGTMSSSIHTIDENKEISANTFIKNGYEFLGWKLIVDDGEQYYNDKQNVKNLAEVGEVVKLYAQWLPLTETFVANMSNGMRNQENVYKVLAGLTFGPSIDKSLYEGNEKIILVDDDDGAEYIECFLANILKQENLDKLKKIGNYTQIKITLTINIQEISDGYQEFYMYDMGSGRELWKKTDIEHNSNVCDSMMYSHTFTTTININDFTGQGIKMVYGAHGDEDDKWQLGETVIIFEIT